MAEPDRADQYFESDDVNYFRNIDGNDVELAFGGLESDETKETERRTREQMRGPQNIALVFRGIDKIEDEEVEGMEEWLRKETLDTEITDLKPTTAAEGQGKQAAGPLVCITDTLAKCTLEDGAVAKDIQLPNNITPRAVVTSLQTSFEVVWYKAHRDIWLHFDTKSEAEAAHRALEGRTIADVRVRCALKEAPNSDGSKHRVQLQDVPNEVHLPVIKQHLPPGADPKRSIFGRLNYPTGDSAIRYIRERISARTGDSIKHHTFISVKNGPKKKAEITLHAEAANLEAHARALDGLPMPQLGKGKVYVVERLRLYLAIDSKVYKRHSKAFKGIANRAWSESAIRVKIFEGELRHLRSTFLVSLEGSGREAIKKVKAEIDTCVCSDLVAGLQRSLDRPTCSHKITLNLAKELIQAMGGGLHRLKHFYGDSNVVFSIGSDPPTIVIKASDNKFARAMSLLSPQKSEQGLDMGECPICAEDVALLKLPSCGHTTCESCLEKYCTIDTGDHLPLKCLGASDCSELLPIHWMEEHLSPVAYRIFLKSVILAHCQRSPETFVICAGPDCNQQLATDKKSSKQICPSCLTVNCTSCKTEYHFGETCAASKARRDPHEQAMQRHLAENNGKPCPRCGTLIIRIDGCNHVECLACRAHICWRCLQWFPNSDGAYAHLEVEHGGPFEHVNNNIDREGFFGRFDQGDFDLQD